MTPLEISMAIATAVFFVVLLIAILTASMFLIEALAKWISFVRRERCEHDAVAWVEEIHP